MKLKFYILSFSLLISTIGFAQVTVDLSICGPNTFTVSGVDNTGRNIYTDANSFATIEWNDAASQWEINVVTPGLWFTNSFASSPNPPCLTTGTWITVDPQCGNVSGVSGDCQSTITSVGELDNNNSIHIFPNPSSGTFNFDGMEAGNTVEIINILGTLVMEAKTETGSSKIDMNNKDKGVYFYRVKHKNTVVKQGKLVLQ